VSLVVGFVADDRAVMASDSQATEADGTRTTIEKIWCQRSLLFGYAGPQAIRDKLQETIAVWVGSATDAELQRRDLVEQKICATSKIVLESMYKNYAQDAGERPKLRLAGQLLVIGCDGDRKHWLLEVDADNTPTYYTEHHFHAGGSGSPAAQVAMALLENYDSSNLSLRGMQAMAYRAVKTSINVLAQYLGDPVQIWCCDSGNGFQKLTATDMDDIERLVEAWTTQERDSLLNILQPDKEKPPLPDSIRQTAAVDPDQ
jgi:20S proteasome alpha/beta subunit